MKNIILIAAIAENNVIGKDGKLPWNIPEDLQRFQDLTSGNAVIMGRKTYESIGKPLKNRFNVVLSSNKDYNPSGVTVCGSLEEAISKCDSYNDIYILGGSKVYETALPIANKLELTKIFAPFEGDTFFPTINFDEWEETNIFSESYYSFITYVRKTNEKNS
ncbi:MAG: dihydrofolate reductase [Nanoarchaeota archaeon]|nr:dihydrofolate reductase [Nanoarchaeota archaeon]MBU1030263.1 dihydrofolate reductase [Nanoarchaeota archaeon]MBU1850718.1 dihydrofolate reductase [Nanoarchaeota archaeon]